MKRAPVRGLAARLAASAGPALLLGATLRERASAETAARRVLWIAVATVLSVGPLVINLGREPQHEATRALIPQAVGPYPAIDDPAYYRPLIDDPELRLQMRLNVGTGVARYADVSVRRGSPSAPLLLTAAAETPREAQLFVNALAPQIAGVTRRYLAIRALRDAAKARERLRERRRSRRARTALRERVRRLERLGQSPRPRVLAGPPATAPTLERWGDRFVDRLPGELPPRPAPAWSAFAGLLVALTLWAVALAVAPPRRRAAPARD